MQTSTLCWIGGKLLLIVLNVDKLILGRQRYIQLSCLSLWPVLLGLSWKGVNCWHLSNSAELIQVGTQWSEIQKLSDSSWNKDWLPNQWTESVYGRGNTTDCNNYWDTTYKILCNIFLIRFPLYVGALTGDHCCQFRYNNISHIEFLLLYC